MSCGGAFTLAINIYGRMYSWGNGSAYALGNGSPHDVDTPKMVPFDIEVQLVSAVSINKNHSMIKIKAGEIYIWGSNKYNQHGMTTEDIEE